MNLEIRNSPRARRVSLTVYPDLRVVLTKPLRMPEFVAKNFAARKADWVNKRLKFYSSAEITHLGPKRSKTRAETLEVVKLRVAYFNAHYKFDIGKISIKDHKSLWGSCSRRKNLNFNHKIVELTAAQMDYIIVHELCHLREFNHSKRFWALVAETMPDFKQIKQQLRKYSFA